LNWVKEKGVTKRKGCLLNKKKLKPGYSSKYETGILPNCVTYILSQTKFAASQMYRFIEEDEIKMESNCLLYFYLNFEKTNKTPCAQKI
jgi:hypothetical protein